MITLNSEKRFILKKRVRSLRKQGIVPAVVYGKGKESLNIQFKEREFKQVFSQAGNTKFVVLKLGDKEIKVLIKHVFKAINGRDIVHVDFYQIQDDVKVKLYVPVKLVGESPLLSKGCLLVKGVEQIYIEAYPKDIIEEFIVDTSILTEIGQSILLEDIKKPEGIRFLSTLKSRLASMSQTRAFKALAEEEAQQEKKAASDKKDSDSKEAGEKKEASAN